MKNREYWAKRFEQLQESLLSSTDEYIKELERVYKSAQRELERELAFWYQRFAENNNLIDLAEARRILRGKELNELKWDINEYIRYGRENNINKKWIKELENASARVHISSLEALQIQTRQVIEKLYDSIEKNIERLNKVTYSESYYKTAYEMAKGSGIGQSLFQLNEDMIEKTIKKPWAIDGKNFSERIWGYKQSSINTIYREINIGLISGRTANEISKSLAKAVGVKESNAKRLVLTESAYFSSLGSKESFEQLGVERYEVLGTLDKTTCSECGGLDGKVYDMKDYEIAVTAPPFHCNCRCTTVPCVNEGLMENEKRTARNEEDKTVRVDNISYEEWKERFVENDVANLKEDDIIKTEGNIMSLEYQRYGRNKDTIVNKTYINSGEYRNKFDKITNNKEVNRILYLKAKEMLEHRSGTLIEDMYWIDSDTGKIIAKVIDETRKKGIVYNNSVVRAIKNEKNITTLHTHPNSMPPSISDFNSSVRNGYRQGLIICHDGKVFLYTANEEVNERLYALYIDDFICEGLSEYEAQIKALNKLKENYDIDFKEVE